MPEGPSLVILREPTQAFAGQRIIAAHGNSKIDKTRLVGQRIVALRTWGKHFLIELPQVAVRIHFLMFGSYSRMEAGVCAEKALARPQPAHVPAVRHSPRQSLSGHDKPAQLLL